MYSFARAHVQPRKADAEVTWPAGGPVHWRKQKYLSLSFNPPRLFSVDYLGSLVATAVNHVTVSAAPFATPSYTFLITVPCLSCCHCRTLKCNVSLPSSGQIMYWLNHGCNKFNKFFFLRWQLHSIQILPSNLQTKNEINLKKKGQNINKWTIFRINTWP